MSFMSMFCRSLTVYGFPDIAAFFPSLLILLLIQADADRRNHGQVDVWRNLDEIRLLVREDFPDIEEAPSNMCHFLTSTGNLG